jgi:hypothetical protein
VMNMFSFELTLGKEAKKLMDLAIPMGWRDYFKEAMEMVKGLEKKMHEPRNFWKRFKSNMRSMPIKHKGVWSLKLGNTCDWTFRILKCLTNWPHVSLLSMWGLMKFYISCIPTCTPWSCQLILWHV